MKNNFKDTNIIYNALSIIGVTYFLYIILFNYSIGPIWELFPDSTDYKIQSEIDFFSLDFFSAEPTNSFNPRPFTVPLLYKLVHSNPYYMVVLQKISYCICILILIFTIRSYLTNQISKIILLYLLLYFFTWWNIVGWTENILSESFSMSFLFLWLATILIYYRKQSNINFILLICVSILLSFTRDTWPYIILLFAFCNMGLYFFIKNRSVKKNIIFLFFSMTLFFVQDYTNTLGERYKIPIFNSIAGRITQTDEYINWFKNEGMPLSEKLLKDFKGINVDDDNTRMTVYSKYSDTTYLNLFNWILKDGKRVYQKFIISHPSYFLMMDQNFNQKNRILCSSISGYTYKPKNFFLKADATFPYFSIKITFLVLFILLIIYYYEKNKKNIVLLFPIILGMLFTVNALISYNADTLEVKRHVFITQIMIDFINIFSIALILDRLICFIKTGKANHLSSKTNHLQSERVKIC